MARQRNHELDRRENADRDPFDNDRDFEERAPPSPWTRALTIAVLVSLGLLLIAYFVLELNVGDLGDFVLFWPIAVMAVFVIARGGVLR